MSVELKTEWVLPDEQFPPEWSQMRSDWGVPDPILTVLWNRGLRSPDEVERFLKPKVDQLHDPFLFMDADRGIARIWKAIESREEILVFGDYDVDGITAAALWTRVLQKFGARVRPVVPNRMEDGYGLSVRAMERAHAAGITLVISNDCGTTSHDAIGKANALGIDVVVCDHHMPESVLPPAYALINPRREDDQYPFPDLAAVGVAFKILQGLVQRHGGQELRNYLFSQLDLVAMGTVADVVPLVDENRIFVHYGVRVLRVRRRPAFRALIEQAHLADKFLESSHLAFSLVPRINAAGRLGVPDRALSLLLEDDLETARKLAARLEEDNNERRTLNERVQEEALLAVDPKAPFAGREAIVLGSDQWHPGVLGIAASRMADQFRVPVFLVSLTGEVGRGSARTPRGIDLLALLSETAGYLTAFGGHKQAAGFSIAHDQFPAFQERLISASRSVLEKPRELTLSLDGSLDPARCDLDLARWIERLGPFGEGNDEPLYSGRAHCQGARVLKERHLRLQVVSEGARVDCIGFGLGDFAEEVPSGGANFRLAYTPMLNRYRGQERLQLKLKEIGVV